MKQVTLFKCAAVIALLEAGVAPGAVTVLVAGGQATANATLSGSWSTVAGELRGTGMTTTVEAKSGVGTGDFVVTAVLNIKSTQPARAGFVIDEVADLGLAVPGGTRVYVRGFLFGDLTTELVQLSSFAGVNEDVTLTCSRVGDLLTCRINGTTVYEMTYEAERPLGKISVRAGSTQIGIKTFTFDGEATSLAGWVSPYIRPHALPDGSVDVFARGSGGYHSYRIPAIVRTNDGTLLAFCEGRKNSASDAGDIDLLVSRSLNGGESWLPQAVAYEEGGTATITIGNPVPVVDRSTGTIWLMFCRNNERVFIGKSTTDGTSWDPPVEITNQVRDASFGAFIATGPGHGFQAPSGELIFPAYHSGTSSSYIISTMNGITFDIGADMGLSSGEPTAVLLSDGKLFMNSRAPRLSWNRIGGISSDLGQTWDSVLRRPDLLDPTCQGSMLSGFGGDGSRMVLFANPDSQRRERVSVRLSEDDGATWSDRIRIYEGSSAYSDIVRVDGDDFGILFERNGYDAITFSPFALTDFPSKDPTRMETALWSVR